MAKHTPGPWTVADYKTINTGNHVVLSPYNGVDDPYPVVASVVKRPGYAANARLIAAAPELLAECRRIHDRIARQIEGPMPLTELEHDDYVRLAKVISKAEAAGS